MFYHLDQTHFKLKNQGAKNKISTRNLLQTMSYFTHLLLSTAFKSFQISFFFQFSYSSSQTNSPKIWSHTHLFNIFSYLSTIHLLSYFPRESVSDPFTGEALFIRKWFGSNSFFLRKNLIFLFKASNDLSKSLK